MKTTAPEKTENKKSRTFCFYTKGDGFTRLIRSFIEEGKFQTAYNILSDGGQLPAEVIKGFFLFKYRFVGDSRDEQGLGLVADKKQYNLSKIYTTAVCTAIAEVRETDSMGEEDEFTYSLESYQWKEALDERLDKTYNKQLAFLTSTIFTFEELSDLCATEILKRNGYKIKTNPNGEYESNGVVLRNGAFIVCGYQDHINLYPVLFQLGLSSSSDWLNDEYTIHVTSGQICGGVGYSIKNPREYWHGKNPTDAQIDTIFLMRKHIRGEYGGFEETTTSELCRIYTQEKELNGGKYNNLAFLKRFYPQINLPVFSRENNIEGKACLRTSPKHSMAGLLNSKFDITPDNVNEAIEQMKSDYNRSMKLLEKDFGENELHYFFQEFLEGDNGVCHYWKNDERFAYAVSDKQGDVVKGKKTNKKLSAKIEEELNAIAKMLSQDLKQSVQLEFVVGNEILYIVQLRTMQNDYENAVVYTTPENALVKGNTFCQGHAEDITLEEILIVESDSDSESLIGKKALIVTSDAEFSHVLALSKTLHIPSMVGTGEVDTTKLKGKLDFFARGKEAWIEKQTKKNKTWNLKN